MLEQVLYRPQAQPLLTPSSYGYLADEFALGDRLASLNAMRWDRVILNLPGSVDYNPALPWVMKWDHVVNQIAGNAVIFVDNIRG
jgi:hypothetical protein